jgi:hypothetical protein
LFQAEPENSREDLMKNMGTLETFWMHNKSSKLGNLQKAILDEIHLESKPQDNERRT